MKILPVKLPGSLKADIVNHIIEIGPGNGMLTKYIFARYENNAVAVEIDQEKVEFLRNEFQGKEYKIIHSDFLKYDLSGFNRPVAIIGNFPITFLLRSFSGSLKTDIL